MMDVKDLAIEYLENHLLEVTKTADIEEGYFPLGSWVLTGQSGEAIGGPYENEKEAYEKGFEIAIQAAIEEQIDRADSLLKERLEG